MRKRYLLYTLIAIPMAVLTWFVIDRAEVPSGFYAGNPYLLAADGALIIAAVFAGSSLSSFAERHGVPYLSEEHGLSWKIVNALFAMAVLLNILCRSTFSRPDASYMLPLWAAAVIIEGIALVCIYLRLLSRESDEPIRRVILAIGPCLYFTADLLNRFFSSSVNKKNIPLMISFLSCSVLAVSSLRMLQMISSGETGAQRRFLSAAFCSFVFCIGIRLPSVLFYLRRGILYELACLAADCAAAVMLFHEAYRTLPEDTQPPTEVE